MHNVESQYNTTPSIALVDASSEVQCPRVTAPPPGTDVAAKGTPHGPQPPHRQSDPPPATPTPCDTQFVEEPAAIVWGQYGPELVWYQPDGRLQHHVNGDMPTASGPPSGLIPIDLAESVAGTNHLVLRLRNSRETYGGNNGWSCGGGVWIPADSCTYQGTQVGGCARTVFVGPQRPASGRIPDPTAYLTNQRDEIKKEVAAGLVGTSPTDTTRQFVFLPSCFWMTGVNAARSFELQVHTPSDGGRSLTYVYRVTVGLQNVRWEYGDGTSYDGDAGRPWSPSTPADCTNAHTYERVSRSGNPGAVACPASYPHPTSDDGCYAVTAAETYSVHVAAYWFDGASPQGPVDLGSFAPITVSPATPTYVRVLQIEGIPFTR